MRLSCDVEVVSRLLSSEGFRGKNRSARTSLAIGKKPCSGISGGLFLMLCTAKDRKGSKYKLKENVAALFTKFVGEGKATVRIREPPHDLFLSKADPIQLKSFLSAIKLGHQDKDLKASHLTTLTPATTSQVERPKTKMYIEERKDYPITTSFAKSLEVLHISNCKLRRFDSRILELKHLISLDLSCNAIENFPDQWGRLKHLAELNLSNNKLKFISKSFIQSSLSQSLCSLDISKNCLQVVPPQLFKFRNLVRINLSENQLQSVPYSAGQMSSLKFLNLSMNALQSIPSSFTALRLDEIDLHGNPFTLECGRDLRQESYTFPSLLEFTGQAVVKHR
ncbi:hypothetical protein BSL78_14480 [Apostichopus japonicus]|uniref:PIF1/LRR1 pleckstrin homology domain-containing protein n=1 Tax=Stichopus japonicus TaxID=307972 RepID=A0A2G8KL40_STIJA|nr:hypothetical protein BSL78_14480 [Apostichopus japonicus]